MSTGLPMQGASPEATYCVHWFTPHPSYANGGLVAIGWYEHGVRFLQITGDGEIAEIGWYVPVGGQSSAAYWIDDRTVYVADYLRGLDILRFTGDVPRGRGNPNAGGRPGDTPRGPKARDAEDRRTARSDRRTPAFDRLVRLPSARRCVDRVGVRVRSARVHRVRVSRDGRRVAGRTVRAPRGRRFSVQVRATLRDGRTTAGQRSYRGCR